MLAVFPIEFYKLLAGRKSAVQARLSERLWRKEGSDPLSSRCQVGTVQIGMFWLMQ
jgi:hypothetical protein